MAALQGPIPPPTAESPNLNFSVELYQASPTEENLFISPISVQLLLGLWLLGAQGNTAEQIRRVLPHRLYTTTAPRTQVDSYAPLEPVGRVFQQNGFRVKDTFIYAVENYHWKTDIKVVDFANGEPTRENINTWVQNKTHSFILNFITPGYIPSDSKLAILSLAYFDREWVQPFDPSRTTATTFHTPDNTTVEVDTLVTTGEFNYTEIHELSSKALLLPFKDSDIQLLVILPNGISDLPDVVEKLATFGLNNVISRLYNTRTHVNVYLPKFNISSETELQGTLGNLQITDIFDDSIADLDGISDTHLKVGQCKHKALIKVNEVGTTAGDADGSLIRPKRQAEETLHPDRKLFAADHAFLFFLLDVQRQVVYFEGRYVDPRLP